MKEVNKEEYQQIYEGNKQRNDDNKLNFMVSNITSKLKGKAKKLFRMKTLKKGLPCLTWFPKYDLTHLVADCIAGLTVSLLIIPQALAYGPVAGLTPNFGLNSAFMGGIIYFFLGSTKELNIGPTAIMSLMTYQYSSEGGADYAVLLCFLAGVIEIFAGVTKLGFFINFISQPVISGFTSAAAITIASSQLNGLFGLNNIETDDVFDTWFQIFSQIKDTVWQDCFLGMSSIAVLVLIKTIYTKKYKEWKSDVGKPRECCLLFFFYLNIGRNALIILVGSITAYVLDGESQPFTLTGKVAAGFPLPELPPFSTTINNNTLTFEENVENIGLGIAMIPFIAILNDIAVVGAISKGKNFDVAQEIIALGVINFTGSFFRSLPTTASLSRTAVNITSGACTPAAGLLTGIIVIIAMTSLTSFFRYIPKATLSAVIICAVMNMFDYEIVKPLWQTKKLDLVYLLITFGACLYLGLEWGILSGIAVNLLFMLSEIATPTVTVDISSFPESNYPFVLVVPNNGIFYPSAMHIQRIILKAGLNKGKGILPTIVDCSLIQDVDYTLTKGLVETVDAYTEREQQLVFLHMKPEIVETIKHLNNEVNSYDSLEDVEKKLYNCSKL